MTDKTGSSERIKHFVLLSVCILFLLLFAVSCENAESGSARFYMLSPDPSVIMNCFVIKTPNDKIIVIDGGSGTKPYLIPAIRAILSLGQNDYFEVEAWFISHMHNDHYGELTKILNEYDENCNFDIKKIYYNAPPLGNGWMSPAGESDCRLPYFELFKQALLRYCKQKHLLSQGVTDSNEAYELFNNSVSAGQVLEIDGVKFQILQTWDEKDWTVNSTSIHMKMMYKNHSVLFLGDSNKDSADRLLKNYNPSFLKSEYVQLAHHGQGGPAKAFYDSIDAINSKRLWATPTWVWNTYTGTYTIYQTRTWFNLPARYEDYLLQGYDKTGNDFVTALYSKHPTNPNLVSDWTEDILRGQMIAEW